MTNLNFDGYIGIDVSKSKIDACIYPDKNLSFELSKEGKDLLLEEMSAFKNPCVVLEATGGYEQPWVDILLEKNIFTVRQNPIRIRSFAKAVGLRAKTDKIDAQMIARYAQTFSSDLRCISREIERNELRTLLDRRQQLIALSLEESNRLETSDTLIKLSVERILEVIRQELSGIEEALTNWLKDNKEAQEAVSVLRTLKGVGPQIALNILAYLPETGHVSRRAIASLLGVAPYPQDSGTSKSYRRVFGGRSIVRKALFMGALTASKYDPKLQAFYQKLIGQGKPKKVALVAVMRKMMVILNSRMKEHYALTEKTA